MKQPPFVAPTQFVPPATYTPTPLAFASVAAAAAPSPTAFTPATTHLTHQSFNTNGGLFATVPPQPVVQDPWTPVVSTTNTNTQLGAPWVKQEPANPFLS